LYVSIIIEQVIKLQYSFALYYDRGRDEKITKEKKRKIPM
jgi:hypothetical protein